MRHILAIVATSFLAWGSEGLRADEMSAVDAIEWTCGQEFVLHRDMVPAVVTNAKIIGNAGAASGKPFLVSDIDDMMLGTTLSVRTGSAWRNYAIEDGGRSQAAKMTADGKHVLIVTMLSREGPGSSFMIMSTGDGFGSFACAELPFPDTVRSPDEFLTLVDLNGSDSGSLALIGSVLPDGKPEQWYRYESADGGKSWGKPTLLDKKPEKLAGGFADIGAEGLAELKADLAASAR